MLEEGTVCTRQPRFYLCQEGKALSNVVQRSLWWSLLQSTVSAFLRYLHGTNDRRCHVNLFLGEFTQVILCRIKYAFGMGQSFYTKIYLFCSGTLLATVPTINRQRKIETNWIKCLENNNKSKYKKKTWSKISAVPLNSTTMCLSQHSQSPMLLKLVCCMCVCVWVQETEKQKKRRLFPMQRNVAWTCLQPVNNSYSRGKWSEASYVSNERCHRWRRVIPG